MPRNAGSSFRARGRRAHDAAPMIARLGMVFYWCGLAIASLCEIAAIAVVVFSMTNNQSASEAWIAAVFFAIVGGASWLVGRVAKYVLAGI
jgi:hypothetical protein